MAYINGEEILFVPIGGGGTADIVVADTDRNQRGIPGLVALYNESSGLKLATDNENRLVIASASDDDITAKTSVTKPIVPARMAKAMIANAFTGDLATASSELPPGAKTVKDFVMGQLESIQSSLSSNVLNFKTATLAKNGGEFAIKPGMFAIVVPYGGTGLKYFNGDGDVAKDSQGKELHGFTIIWSSDKGYEPKSWDSLSEYFRVLLVWIDGLSSDFYHNAFKNNWRVVNQSSSGNAYVFYIE